MPESNGILHKINRAFLLQGLLIAIAAILGVFFAKIVIEEILVKSAIQQEEDFFWENYQQDSNFPLPNTKNLTGFFDPNALPEYIKKDMPLKPGFYEYDIKDDRQVFHVSKIGDKTLYLVYYRGQVDALVLYYGLFPLLTVLVILYLSLWLTYRFNRKTVSPLIWLADQINRVDFSAKNFSFELQESPFDNNDEITILFDAITQLGNNLNAYINRERNFTRDTSHELRSPLTVINIATDLLLSESDLSPGAEKSISRIKRAIEDMEQLTEVFLLLAREDDQALEVKSVEVNQVINQQVEHAKMVHRNKPVEIIVVEKNIISLTTSDMVLGVLLGNLIRNAILYTDSGTVQITLDDNRVLIEDSGQGMNDEQLKDMFKPYHRGSNVNASGFGVGLTIVKRLSDRFNWPIEVQSIPGEGTLVKVEFPNANSATILSES